MFLAQRQAAAEDEKRAAHEAQGSSAASSHVQSYFWIVRLVGALGIALPFILLILEPFIDDASIGMRGSLSAYYHSGVRDVFVIILAVVGILLITYKISERNYDFWVTAIAGVAAIGVALVPTGIPCEVREQATEDCKNPGGDVRPTVLQDTLTEGLAAGIHLFFATVFIVFLMRLCFEFARRELDPNHHSDLHGGRGSSGFRYRFHRRMGRLIGVAIGFILLMWLLEEGGVDENAFFIKHKLFIGEFLATLAFGASWLAEGQHIPVLFAKAAPQQGGSQEGDDLSAISVDHGHSQPTIRTGAE